MRGWRGRGGGEVLGGMSEVCGVDIEVVKVRSEAFWEAYNGMYGISGMPPTFRTSLFVSKDFMISCAYCHYTYVTLSPDIEIWSLLSISIHSQSAFIPPPPPLSTLKAHSLIS